MKVSHSTRTANLQLVYPACAAFQEHVETRIWNFHFLSVFSAKLRLGRISAVVTGGEIREIEVPSRVDGKRRNLARVSDFVSWDEACRVPRHKITHECKIPPLSIHE